MANSRAATQNGKKAKPADKLDGDTKKRFPNGISSTVLAIQRYWTGVKSGSRRRALTVGEFYLLTNFKEIYDKVTRTYPGKKKKPGTPGSVASMVNDITAGRQDVEFYKLRSFAQFVGLPTGIFLLFTQFVSKEMKALRSEEDIKEVALEHIRRVRSTIEEAEKLILNSPPGKRIFTEVPEDDEHQIANIATLKMWVDAFGRD